MAARISVRVKNGKVIGAHRVDGPDAPEQPAQDSDQEQEEEDEDDGEESAISRLIARAWTIPPERPVPNQQQKAAEIISRAKSLPTLPTAVAALSKLMSDPMASSADFERVVRPDPALTANLLRLANSPYFGARREIVSVRHAITYLGGKRVFDLAAAAWYGRSLPKRLPGYDISAKSYWLHCIAVGALAEQLATLIKLGIPDLTFTAGLLHDIGKLAIGTVLKENLDEITGRLSEGDATFIEAEREVIGTDHTEVGSSMVDDWNLPPVLAATARWHHYPSELDDPRFQTVVDLVHLSDNLAHSLGFGTDIGELNRRIDRRAVQRLYITGEDLEVAAGEEVVCHIWEMGELVAGSLDP